MSAFRWPAGTTRGTRPPQRRSGWRWACRSTRPRRPSPWRRRSRGGSSGARPAGSGSSTTPTTRTPSPCAPRSTRSGRRRARAGAGSILGDMLELGAHTEAAHRELGPWVAGAARRRSWSPWAPRCALAAEAARAAGCPDVATFASPEGAAAHADRPRRARGPRAGQGIARHADGAGGRRAPGRARRARGGVAVLTALAAFAKYHIVFNVFRYITFRTAMALVTALVLSLSLGPWMIRKLRERQIGETIRERRPGAPPDEGGHAHDGRDPDLGVARRLRRCSGATSGTATCGSLLLVTLALGRDRLLRRLAQAPARRPLKIAPEVRGPARGRPGGRPLPLPVAGRRRHDQLSVPFLKDGSPDLGPGTSSSWSLIFVGASNAVNLTDGLDGLAIGPRHRRGGRLQGHRLRRRQRRCPSTCTSRRSRARAS